MQDGKKTAKKANHKLILKRNHNHVVFSVAFYEHTKRKKKKQNGEKLIIQILC